MPKKKEELEVIEEVITDTVSEETAANDLPEEAVRETAEPIQEGHLRRHYAETAEKIQKNPYYG